MRGMPWRMERLQDAVPDAERRLVVEDDHPVLRHREYLAPEPLHVLLEDPRGAGQKLGGIDQVRGADPVDEQARSRETLDQRPRSPGVIEVDVGHDEPGDPVRIEPGGADPGEQRLHGSRRSLVPRASWLPLEEGVGSDLWRWSQHAVQSSKSPWQWAGKGEARDSRRRSPSSSTREPCAPPQGRARRGSRAWRHALWCGRKGWTERRMEMSFFPRRILLAVDGSEEARLATQAATELSGTTGSEVQVVYVLPSAGELIGPTATPRIEGSRYSREPRGTRARSSTSRRSASHRKA